MVIEILDLTGSADTSAQGAVLFARMQAALRCGDGAVVSFRGIKTATSSFVNASFVELLRTYSLEQVKRRVRVVNSTRQINEMIKTRLERESQREMA